jgi:hypothetical protein
MIGSPRSTAAHRRPTLNYRNFRLVLAGVSAVAIGILGSSPALASGVLPDNIPQTTTFTDANASTTMTIAFDGTHYWSTSGGGSGGTRLREYDASGTLVASFAPGLDFRSIFTNASGQVFARAFNSPVIYLQGSPGVFAPSVTLTGGSLNAQSSVVLNSAGDRYIAHSGSTVLSWDLTGALVGTTTLVGFGTLPGENSGPTNRGIAAFSGMWLSYIASSRTLSAWDPATGTRLGQGVLTGAGTGFDSAYSFSFARGQVYVVDSPGAAWRGFALRSTSTVVSCTPATVAVGSPSTCTATVTDTGAGALSAPTGSVSFTESGGTFTGNPCTLAAVNGSSSSCQVTYTGATMGSRVVTANYLGGSHLPSSATATLTVRARSTSSTLSCTPASVAANGTTTCTATVADTDSGNKSAPTGSVSFAGAAAGATFAPTQCTLAPVGATTTSSCSATYISAANGAGTTITASYSGDTLHAAAVGSFTFAPGLPAAGRFQGGRPAGTLSPWAALAMLVGAGGPGTLALGLRRGRPGRS